MVFRNVTPEHRIGRLVFTYFDNTELFRCGRDFYFDGTGSKFVLD